MFLPSSRRSRGGFYSPECVEGKFSEVGYSTYLLRTSRTITNNDAAIASPANPTTARAGTTPEVSLRASPPSFGFSLLPSNARSAPALESSLVSPQR